MTISAFCSLSLDPPLVLFCLNRNSSHRAALTHGNVCISILSEEQASLSSRFASKSEDRFAGLDLDPTPQGIPAPAGGLARLDCRVVSVAEGGDHDIVICAVEAATHADEKRPLVHCQGAYHGVHPLG
ncbi:hypothetical protein ROR02_06000 [Pararhodospirillum oryzae]|uniref:Flavin reductase like domain-containing protein n=1 Tax=Pararhodospirillum oryzae TaxID=478448 RepID=A0A512H4S3_9PROT|nr:hypothetical protein ROR02_06000 [Pararhodospirillum oryzae]